LGNFKKEKWRRKRRAGTVISLWNSRVQSEIRLPFYFLDNFYEFFAVLQTIYDMRQHRGKPFGKRRQAKFAPNNSFAIKTYEKELAQT
jgi:hypothetical protein